MKAVVQRVCDASVSVAGEIIGSIGFGLLVYLGVALEDTTRDADWLIEKITNLRIFDDSEGKMNLSLIDVVNSQKNQVNAGILTISQFTLLGDVKKGRRPSWVKAAPPEKAEELYGYFTTKIREKGFFSACGKFQARMKVHYTNEGPVTILLDSRE